ncbi:MAG TPA: nicotinate-nucleotide adenylyltransferase [Nitrospiria bacterium]
MRKIGILGGTFDPIHKGHIAIAEAVRKRVGLDRILLIPSNRPPHKTDRKILPGRHRHAMVRLAVKGHRYLEASGLEYRRPGKSYTVDTLRALRKKYGGTTELFLILGVDAFLDLPSWRAPQEILRSVNVVVVSRPGFRFSSLKKLPFLKSCPKSPFLTLDRGSRRRYEFPLTGSTRAIFIRVPSRDVSATRVRELRLRHRSLKNLLPALVDSYIIKNNLYAEALSPENSKRFKGTRNGRNKKENPSRG